MMTMKILLIAPYMTNNNVPLLSQCKAGFGYMVYDIAASVAEKQAAEALLFNYRYDSFRADHIGFVGSSWSLFLKNITKCCSPFMPIRLYAKYRMQLRTFVRLCYGWLISGYYKDVIQKGDYDVVHIHGCGFMNEYFIDICKKLKIPFVVTLHGLNSFSDSVKLEPAGKKYEKDFLKETLEKGYDMTVIASGIKRTILEHFGVKSADNIRVVNNAFKFGSSDQRVDIRNKYSIPADAKILVYVGNISSNKNQEQMVRAFSALPNDWRDRIYVLFLGRNNEAGYSIEALIEKGGFKKHLILCGNIDKSEIASYYEQADAVALLSIAEGFGLSLIEGMHFGLPCMTYTDLDAFNDIYTDKVVVAIPDREDETVAECLISLFSKDWDPIAIKQYSKRFESCAMADNYINVYKEILR